jgi:hypothetical protein
MYFHHRTCPGIRPAAALLALFTGLIINPHPTTAHGFAGDRFFPATLTTDDPFVADEGSLPTLSTIRPAGEDAREFDVEFDFSKRITPYLDAEFTWDAPNLFPRNGRDMTGLTNMVVGSKFQFYTNAPHEFIMSLGLNVTVGGTGSKEVGRAPFSTWSPGLFFGKGFGDLPSSLPWLRPFALTGNISVDMPSSASTRTFGSVDPVTGIRATQVDENAASVETDFALEYSLIYLQEHVKNVGLKAPFDRLIPMVEGVIATPFDRGQGGLTTGSINPGVVWSGQYCQFGLEALIPINHRSGTNVGVLAQMHFYLDDICPKIFRPLFSGGATPPASSPASTSASNTNSTSK